MRSSFARTLETHREVCRRYPRAGDGEDMVAADGPRTWSGG